MRKVIKILLSTLSTLILIVVAVPLVLALLLHVPSFQNMVIKRTTEWATKKLGNEISIDHFMLKPISKLELDGVYIADHHADTLFYAGRITVGINTLGLLTKNTSLGDVRIEEGKLYLVQDELGINGLKDIIYRLRKKPWDEEKEDKEPKFRIKATSVTLDRFRIVTNEQRPSQEVVDGVVNFGRLDARASLIVKEVTVVGDSIAVGNIPLIELEEKSGFHLKKMTAGKVGVSGKGIFIRDAQIVMPDSKLNIPKLAMLHDDWDDYGDFINKVCFDGQIVNSTVGYGTIACFAEPLKEWESVYRNLSATVYGTLANLSGKITSLEMGTETSLKGDFRIKGIPDIPNTRFELDITELHTVSEDIKIVVGDVVKTNPQKILDMTNGLAWIDLKGQFSGLLTDFDLKGEFSSSLGGGVADVSMAIGKKVHLEGDISVSELDVGTLVDLPKLGKLTLNSTIDGQTGADGTTIGFRANVARLDFNDYNYNRIKLNGKIDNRKFVGEISSSDPNIEFNFNGNIDFNEKIPRYDFDMTLHNADLSELNFNRRDSVSVLRCQLRAQAWGADVDHFNGLVTVSDLVYIGPSDTLNTSTITLLGQNDDNRKSLQLRSKFADVDFKSRINYSDIFRYITSVASEYLPTLYEPDENQNILTATPVGDVNDPRNYSTLTLTVKDASGIAGIFVPGLKIAPNTKAGFMFNPFARYFSLTAESDYVDHNNFFASKINASIDTRNQADSLTIYANSEDLYAFGIYMPNFVLNGGAKNSKLDLSTRIVESKENFDLFLGITAELGREIRTGRPQINMRFKPSWITTGGETWRVTAQNIMYDSTRVVVDKFRILRSGQELVLNGVASRSDQDTLRLRLDDFDIEPLSRLTTRMGYNIKGITNGYVDMASVMENRVLYADILLDSVKINDLDLPTSRIESRWDANNKRAEVALGRPEQPPLLWGYYYPQSKELDFEIKFNDIDLSLINPIASAVIYNSKGSASTSLKVRGTPSAPVVDGLVRVTDFSSAIDFSKVRYSAKTLELKVQKSMFTLAETEIQDPEGNKGKLSAELDLRTLKGYKYEIKAEPNNMLVLATTAQDNEYYYGKIYGSGMAIIKGNMHGTTIDITARTDDNSSFFMPLGGNSTVHAADFIVFESVKDKEIEEDYVSSRRNTLNQMVKGERVSKNNLEIKMQLEVLPNTDFQLDIGPMLGHVLKAQGNGRLNINVSPRDNVFTMYGNYELTEGSYMFNLQNLISRKFTLSSGSMIRWTGDPIDAQLDIKATYRVKTTLAPLFGETSKSSGTSNTNNIRIPVDCVINIDDRLSMPVVTLGVELPEADSQKKAEVAGVINTQELMATQFFWLLAANTFYMDQSSTGGVTGGSVGIEFLSSLVSNALSSDKYNIGIRYSQGKRGQESDIDNPNPTDPGEFGFGFSTAFMDDRLLLEVEGNYDFDNTTSTTRRSPLMGDFQLVWLIDKQGRFRAKAFSRTSDRFEDHQGQESGVGVFYGEDFDKVSDIGRNFKERFGRKKRKKTESETEVSTEGVSGNDNEIVTGNQIEQ